MHQKILDWGLALLAFAIGLIALIGALLFAWHIEEATPWADMKAADWGVWAGALGTVATLAGTIWIATSADRKAKREQLDLAVIAAVSAAVWIADFRGAVWHANQGKPDSSATPFKAIADLNNCLWIIEEIGVFDMNDLRPLVYLPNHLAARMAQTSKDIISTITHFRHSIRAVELGKIDITTAHTHFIEDLRISNDELFPIQDECLSFLALHGYGERQSLQTSHR